MCRYFVFLMAFWGMAADTVIVQNGHTPKNKGKTLVFEDDLRFGGGDEDHLIWSGEDVGIDVNDKGHIFIVDNAANRILEFDPKGNYLRQIGRQGEGPGEFSGLKHLSILKDQSAIALDQVQGTSSFVYFDKDMKYQRVKSVSSTQKVGVAKLLRSAIFSPDGKYIYSAYLQGPPLAFHVALLDSDMNVIDELRTGSTVPLDNERMGKSEFWIEYFADWFQVVNKPGLVAFHSDGSIYTSRGGEYKITKWSNDRVKQMVIKRDYKPLLLNEDELSSILTPVKETILASFPQNLAQMVTDRVMREAIVRAEIPPGKTPIFGMVPMEMGELLVVHDYNALTRESVADIFDAKGVFTGTVKLPPVAVNIGGGFFGQTVRLFFKGGYAYGLELNEDDEFNAVRYKYQWK